MAFLCIIAFVLGAIVLVLETLGALLLAPYFGTSVTTWSALITTTLAALAAGAALGGRFADRRDPRNTLASLLIGAALWLLIVPTARGVLLPPLTAFGIKFGALTAGALLFFAPLAALGAATPLLVRLAVKAAGETGRAYGLMSAVSTIGGVLGALASGFWLLPNWSVTTVLVGTSVVLILSAATVRWTVQP